MRLAYIPSPPPEWSSFSIGPLTVHAYALFILAGIVVATLIAMRRWKDRGGNGDVVLDIVFWAVPFGIVGGRIYHVISTPAPYFGEDGDFWKAFRIWEGGLGIWGAIALGALGAYIGARRAGVSFSAFADAVAPGVLVAQAIGRLGNYFNQELYGQATDVPWAVEICTGGYVDGVCAGIETFHPTFLYEILWNLAGAALIIWADRRLDLRGGRVFWLYVLVYTLGRLWIEALRIDEAVLVLGLRINIWTSLAVIGLSATMFYGLGRRQKRTGEDQTPRDQLAAAS